MTSSIKRCSKCYVVKKLAEFYKDRSRPDGHSYWCKGCQRQCNRENHDPEYHRQYFQAHREEFLAYAHRWRIANPKKSRAIVKAWKVANPKRNRELNRRAFRKYRARKMGAEGSYTAKQFKALCKKYNNRCLACGKKSKLTADHVIPLVRGGSDDISNIQPLCQSCNSSKSTMTADYRYSTLSSYAR